MEWPIVKTYSRRQPLAIAKQNAKLVPCYPDLVNAGHVRESRLNDVTLHVDDFENTFDKLLADVVIPSPPKDLPKENDNDLFKIPAYTKTKEKKNRKHKLNQDKLILKEIDEKLEAIKIKTKKIPRKGTGVKKKILNYKKNDENVDYNNLYNESIVSEQKRKEPKRRIRKVTNKNKETSPLKNKTKVQVKECTIALERCDITKNILTSNENNQSNGLFKGNDNVSGHCEEIQNPQEVSSISYLKIADNLPTSTPRENKLKMVMNMQNISPIKLDKNYEENIIQRRLSAKDLVDQQEENFSLEESNLKNVTQMSSKVVGELFNLKSRTLKSRNHILNDTENKTLIGEEDNDKSIARSSNSNNQKDISSQNLTPVINKHKNVSFVESPLLFDDTEEYQSQTDKNKLNLITKSNEILKENTQTFLKDSAKNNREGTTNSENQHLHSIQNESSYYPDEWSNDYDSSYEYTANNDNTIQEKLNLEEGEQSIQKPDNVFIRSNSLFKEKLSININSIHNSFNIDNSTIKDNEAENLKYTACIEDSIRHDFEQDNVHKSINTEINHDENTNIDISANKDELVVSSQKNIRKRKYSEESNEAYNKELTLHLSPSNDENTDNESPILSKRISKRRRTDQCNIKKLRFNLDRINEVQDEQMSDEHSEPNMICENILNIETRLSNVNHNDNPKGEFIKCNSFKTANVHQNFYENEENKTPTVPKKVLKKKEINCVIRESQNIELNNINGVQNEEKILNKQNELSITDKSILSVGEKPANINQNDELTQYRFETANAYKNLDKSEANKSPILSGRVSKRRKIDKNKTRESENMEDNNTSEMQTEEKILDGHNDLSIVNNNDIDTIIENNIRHDNGQIDNFTKNSKTEIKKRKTDNNDERKEYTGNNNMNKTKGEEVIIEMINEVSTMDEDVLDTNESGKSDCNNQINNFTEYSILINTTSGTNTTQNDKIIKLKSQELFIPIVSLSDQNMENKSPLLQQQVLRKDGVKGAKKKIKNNKKKVIKAKIKKNAENKILSKENKQSEHNNSIITFNKLEVSDSKIQNQVADQKFKCKELRVLITKIDIPNKKQKSVALLKKNRKQKMKKGALKKSKAFIEDNNSSIDSITDDKKSQIQNNFVENENINSLRKSIIAENKEDNFEEIDESNKIFNGTEPYVLLTKLDDHSIDGISNDKNSQNQSNFINTIDINNSLRESAIAEDQEEHSEDTNKSNKNSNGQELCALLSKLNDPIKITMRRDTYRKHNKPLAVISEDKAESPNVTNCEANTENCLNKENNKINENFEEGSSREECEIIKSINNRTSLPVFLKPGKSWARSLSIINHFHNRQNLEELAIGRGQNWRHSVQTILNMQPEGTIENIAKQDDEEKESQTQFYRVSEILQRESNRFSRITTSPSRASRPFSMRIVPSGKRSTLTDDFINSERNSSVANITRKTSISRKTSLRIQRNTLIETEDDLIRLAKDIILKRCKQRSYLPFDVCFPDSYIEHCRKIGEGVYGEVFLYDDGTKKSVIKIIPIEGEELVNSEPQKKFHEILSEIIIAEELHKLKFGDDFRTNGFVGLNRIKCVIGKYPDKMIDLWKQYDRVKFSENDCPSMFSDQQLYIILDLAHGGQDLEAYVFQNASESYSIFLQTAYTLAVAEQCLEFEHRDLHWGNLLISKTDDARSSYKLGTHDITLPTNGVKVSVIDFTLSRMSYQGCKIFNDLASDPTLFEAKGEYQFDIYRMMRDSVNNDWQQFNPYTNVLWLDYTLDKMITAARYKRKTTKVHKTSIEQMKQLRKEILNYKSTFDFVTNCEKIKVVTK